MLNAAEKVWGTKSLQKRFYQKEKDCQGKEKSDGDLKTLSDHFQQDSMLLNQTKHVNHLRGLLSAQSFLNQDTSDNFYTRTTDKFCKSLDKLTPGNEPLTDTENVNEYISIDNDEAWCKHFSTVIASEEGQKRYRHKFNNRYEYRHEHKYDAKNIVGKFAKQIAEEISKSVEDNTVQYIGLKESRKKGKIEPAVRIMLSDLTRKINMVDILNGNMCKKYGVKGITLLLPTEDKYEKRGIRGRIDEHGTRIYEVANESYEMDLKWYVEGKECNIKISISDDGSVELLANNSNVTWEQIAAHKEVKVGRQYEAKSLYEALSYLQEESSEVVKVLPQPSTNIKDVGAPQAHQASVSQRCMYPLL